MIATDGKITELNKDGSVRKIINYNFFCRDVIKHMDGHVFVRVFFFKESFGKQKLVPVYQLEPTFISEEFFVNFIKNRKVELINYKVKAEIESQYKDFKLSEALKSIY